MSINDEKQKIIDCPGNVLVTANPGTGKTLLLAHKYVSLLQNGAHAKDILCLTFTRKARKEMEERITDLLHKKDLVVDPLDLNIHTFHSYALENLEESTLVSTNLLRYAIFRFIKEHKILSYSDAYLLDTIVPKMENLIRYLKSYGVGVDDIDIGQVKGLLTDFKEYSKKDLEDFTDRFVEIYRYYETIKCNTGLDYTDMLINFLKKPSLPRFASVLVDELQDVNTMEAEIALRSADCFIAVGDQKQAIFGFQGGSILNFKKFDDSIKFVLSENFRSTNGILSYARAYFSTRTKQDHHRIELKDLENKTQGFGEKPIICDAPRSDLYPSVCQLVESLTSRSSTLAIIARTNTQIMMISRELQRRGIKHSSTFFSASSDAQSSIITFLRALVHNNMDHVKAAMFTPFFPISIQDAFELSEQKYLSLDIVYNKSPGFKQMRKDIRSVDDVGIIFENVIIPVALTYGEEYLLAALGMMDAFSEAIKLLSDRHIDNIASFLEVTDLASSESTVENPIILTTVHKSKGKQFDDVIYVPSKTTDKSNFQDMVVKTILHSKGFNAEEELEEETLRVNFVAFTRAKKRLFIVTDKPNEYRNEFSIDQSLEGAMSGEPTYAELKRRAYTLFVCKQYSEAQKLIEQKRCWLRDYIRQHFMNLESISFSSLTTDPYLYLKRRILQIGIRSESMNIGTQVHLVAEKIIEGEAYTPRTDLQQQERNIQQLLDEIHQNYPHDVGVEEIIKTPLSTLIDEEVGLLFSGKIDAVFKNDADEYLIVDWKTDRNTNYAAEHRQQLSTYRKVYSLIHGIPIEKIKVAIGYVGLRKVIDDGVIRAELDIRQPSATAFDTFTKHLKIFLSWRNDVDLFFKALSEVKDDEVLLRSVLEQYSLEID